MRKILMSPMGSLSQVLSPDRDKSLGFLHRIVFSDIIEFQRHPGPLLPLTFPDPNPLPPLLARDVGFGLLFRQEYRIPEGLKERKRIF